MIFKTFISTSAAIMAFASGIAATMAPNYPQPGTVWTAGKQYTITWADDGASPSMNETWKSFKIDLMTGDNINMVELTNVATGLDASAVSSYTWTAPQVDPYSAIYFLQFTNEKNEAAWTTRFAIVAQDGDIPAKEPEADQPNSTGGDPIPWGVGKLGSGAAPAASSPAASSPAASSLIPAESSSSAPAESSNAPADANTPAAESPESTTKAEKDKQVDDSGVSAIRASLGTLAVAMVAAGYTLA